MALSPIDGPRGPSSPASISSDVVTPSRKVQALLARFDDSESDASIGARDASEEERKRDVDKVTKPPMQDDSEDDELSFPARSRMAARLQGLDKSAALSDNIAGEQGQADERVKHQIAREIIPEDHQEPGVSGGISEDELSKPAPKRRLLLKRKSSPAHISTPTDRAPRSVSPLFFQSPSEGRTAAFSSPARNESDSDDLFNHKVAGGNSKFLALVEKHRKQRLEKEAGEVAKKAAHAKSSSSAKEQPLKPRGSSPADDTEEDSDISNDGAARRLTKEARPMRKASKKAVEEMNRETQRMSRNMQLAHQARTKKKITKESLLAIFNFPIPGIPRTTEGASHSTTASSAAGSDNDNWKDHSTPPTSPLRETFSEEDGLKLTKTMLAQQSTENQILQIDNGVLGFGDNIVRPVVNKGKDRAMDWISGSTMGKESLQPKNSTTTETPPEAHKAKPTRANLAARAALLTSITENESELEIITSKGQARKYAAFERLPKRKAKETQSHIALRALAHLVGNDDVKHSSMTGAEMEASLRRAARMQAQAERQLKINELKAKGVVIQTAEERERDQQDVEDIVERARQEAAEISKREKAIAKKDGTFVRDALNDDDSDDEDEDFQEEGDDIDEAEDSEEQSEEDNASDTSDEEGADLENDDENLIDAEADEHGTDEASDEASAEELSDHHNDVEAAAEFALPRKSRNARVVSDDEDDEDVELEISEHQSPQLPAPAKTPQSLVKSARKQIPGLQMSDDLPLGLTQAFAATMADSQSQGFPETQEQYSLEFTRDLPSPNIAFPPPLNRLDSIDMVSDSQPASQTQPLNVDLSYSQSQQIPQSPAVGLGFSQAQFTPSQLPFEPTQDAGYMFSPFQGSRFATETPHYPPNSTIDTVIVPELVEDSPIMQRKGRLRRGRVDLANSDDDTAEGGNKSAFELMRRAAKKADPTFDKSKSHAKEIVDDAAEESEDEYAGLGGASDDDGNDEENEDDRRMIDEDTQVGRGDEAKLAGLYADRERKQDEAAVSKLLKDITTGALRRKRGANDDLDLSDEEDAAARRREAKRREFAKMRRELLKDEAVGKIAEDKKKEAFLRSIEDREAVDDDDDDDDENFDKPETPLEDSQELSQIPQSANELDQDLVEESIDLQTRDTKRKTPLNIVSESKLNRAPSVLRLSAASVHKRPNTLAEIRETVSFLVEEPDSQAGMIDLGLSDSEEEPETLVNLDRHFKNAVADENAADDDADDLGDFIVDDDGLAKDDSQDSSIFKKPSLPTRAPFSERRTKARPNVVNRLSMKRQASSSSSSTSSSNTKMAFFTANSSTESLSKVPTLLRRATTNSSFGSNAGRENVSATGVVTSKTERGSASEEKEFVRKGSGGRRNAVNYRPTTVKEEKMSQRAGVVKKGKKGGGSGFLGALLRGDSWA